MPEEVIDNEDDLELLDSVLPDEEPDEDVDNEDKNLDDEAEKEPEEDSEEEEDLSLPLKTTYSSVKEKYPSLFKDFPELKNIFFKGQAYEGIFPTVEDAKEALEDIDAYSNLRESAFNGNPELIVKVLHESDKTAFTLFSRNFLPTLYKTSPEVYEECITPVIENIIRHVYKDATNAIGRGDKERGEALQAAVRLFAENLLGEDGKDIAAGLKTMSKALPKNEEDSEKVSTAFNAAMGDVTTTIGKSLQTQIRKGLDPNGILTPFVRKTVIAQTIEQVNKQLAEDTQWMTAQAARWKRAKREGFDDGSKRKIINAYLARAQALVPTIRRKVVEEATGVRRKASDGKVRDIRDKSPKGKEITNGRSRNERTSEIDSTRRIDYSKTTDEDILNGKITYRS